MTAMLPFVEKIFDIQTDINLLELGDAAHPLLQELVRRAPGTYNHSINVGSIAEAAADAIDANGLLCPELSARGQRSAQAISEIAISCFSYENFAVPVIDLTRVFERAPPQ